MELFFKALKQSLRIKTFVGTSPNAVMVQIWTALIAMLVVKYLPRFDRTWLNAPFQPPPELVPVEQLALTLG